MHKDFFTHRIAILAQTRLPGSVGYGFGSSAIEVSSGVPREDAQMVTTPPAW